jgi:hypothetical protein
MSVRLSLPTMRMSFAPSSSDGAFAPCWASESALVVFLLLSSWSTRR